MLNLEIAHDPKKDDDLVVRNGLVNFNADFFVGRTEKKISCYARGKDNQIFGGVCGRFLYSSLYIDLFWVHEDFRYRGVGKALLEALETEARLLSVETIVLDTFSFQAPLFYEKYGYFKVGEIVNYPKNGINKLIYQKDIR